MISIVEKSKCCGCSACMNVCPKNCITMVKDSEGFLYPQVDKTECVGCRLCKIICPIFHPIEKEEFEVEAYAAINSNLETRKNSSSGGIFSLLSEHVINHHGVIFGAALSDDCKSVHHVAVVDAADLHKLRGSKYLQSQVGDSYVLVKKYLDEGRLVLFTGTPCQIGGLCAFLRRDYDNLYLQDIVCHGVPSPEVWKKYVEYREAAASSCVQRTYFRHKKYGWNKYSVQFKFLNCTEYLSPFSDDLFMKGFLNNLYLRPSCYHCAFKGLHRLSDITLADFWGIQAVLPEMDDDKGTSLVLINSVKGQVLWNAISKESKFAKVDVEDALRYNPSAIKSVDEPEKRRHVMDEIWSEPFEFVINKYLYVSTPTRIMRKIRRCLSKVKYGVLKSFEEKDKVTDIKKKESEYDDKK